MNKTKIEWVKNPDGTQGYTINPIKGLCPMTCPYCYARAMYKRFKWNPEIRFMEDAMDICLDMKRGSHVFIGSTMELFGDWIKPEWLKSILGAAKVCSEITFIFLTKQPQNLIKWSPFPENCWVGVTITNEAMLNPTYQAFAEVEAKLKFLSIEPLLHWKTKDENFYFMLGFVNWLITGQQTPISAKTSPKIEWIQEIVKAADKAGIPVFLKDNLRATIANSHLSATEVLPFYDSQTCDLRQELPK